MRQHALTVVYAVFFVSQFRSRSAAELSHGVCPECTNREYPNIMFGMDLPPNPPSDG